MVDMYGYFFILILLLNPIKIFCDVLVPNPKIVESPLLCEDPIGQTS